MLDKMQRNLFEHKSRNLMILAFLVKSIKGNSCFTYLKRVLPAASVKRLDDLVNLKCKIVRKNTRIDFLRECVHNGVYPAQFCKLLRKQNLRPVKANLKRFAKCSLDSEIRQRDELQMTLVCNQGILDELSLYARIKFTVFSADIVRKTRQQLKERLEKSLRHNLCESQFPTDPSKFITNLSSTELTRVQKEALSLGLKYCIKPWKINPTSTRAQFENFWNQLSDLHPTSKDSEQWLKAKLVDIEHQYRVTPTKQCTSLIPEHIRQLKLLRQKMKMSWCYTRIKDLVWSSWIGLIMCGECTLY